MTTAARKPRHLIADTQTASELAAKGWEYVAPHGEGAYIMVSPPKDVST